MTIILTWGDPRNSAAGMSEWKPDTPLHPTALDTYNFAGLIPESWLCVDCGFDTAPGMNNRSEAEAAARELGLLWKENLAGTEETIGFDSEVYTVRPAVWEKAGMEGWGGCLCIGCLERRIGRRLKPKDFLRDHPFNVMPGTPRLLDRRK